MCPASFKASAIYLSRLSAYLTGLIYLILYTANVYAISYDSEKYIKQFVAELNSRNEQALSNRFDSDLFVEKVFSGEILEDKYKQSYKKGIDNSITNASRVIVNKIPENGFVKLVRLVKGEQYDKALLRFDLGDSGYGFRDIYLNNKTKNNKKIFDWYDYALGQKFTEFNRKLLILSFPKHRLISLVLNISVNRKQDIDNLFKLVKSVRDGAKVDAMKIYEEFDESFKKNKQVVLLVYAVASRINNEALYKKTLYDLNKYHGNDPSLNFIFIDHFFYQKKYNKAIKSIDILMQEVGRNDAALLGLKANIYYETDQCKQTIKYAKLATQHEPEFEQPYWVLLSCYAKLNQYQNAVQVMGNIEKIFNMVFDVEVLRNESLYKNLVKSQEFKIWYDQSLSKKNEGL